MPWNNGDSKDTWKVCQIFGEISVRVEPDSLEVCHWLKNKGRNIVKFLHRRDCQQVTRIKKELRRMGYKNLDFPERTNIFAKASVARM